MALFHTHALLSSGPDEQQNQTAWESSGSFGKPTQRPAASSLGTHAAPEAVSSAEWPAFLSLRLLSEQGRPRSGQHQPHRGGAGVLEGVELSLEQTPWGMLRVSV